MSIHAHQESGTRFPLILYGGGRKDEDKPGLNVNPEKKTT